VAMKYYLWILISIGLPGASQPLAKTNLDTPLPLKVGSYGNINFKREKVYLDRFVSPLRKEPGAQAYIVVCGVKRAQRNEAVARGRRAKAYLVRRRGIVAERIVIVDGGSGEKLTVDLWVIRPGGVPPTDCTW
jgi:hypothetical protein